MMKIPATKVIHKPEDIERIALVVKEVLANGPQVLGKYTRQFEEEWAKFVGSKYGVALANDTGALEITLRMIAEKLPDFKPGVYEVLLPATSFFSCATAAKNAGFVPRVVDIGEEKEDSGFGIFPIAGQVAEELSSHPRIKVFMSVYAGGYVGYDAEVIASTRMNGECIVMEDAAHCHGATVRGIMAGRLSDIACWSFYSTKVLNCGEGGAITTDNEEFAQRAKLYRNYGRADDFGRSLAMVEGNNWRLTEYQAFIGVTQTQQANWFIDGRRESAALYDKYVGKLKEFGIYKIWTPEWSQPNYYRYIVMLPKGQRSHAFKYVVKAEMKKRGISLAGEVYEQPIHKQPIFEDVFRGVSAPNAEDYCYGHLCLPIWQYMDEEEVVYVVDNLVEVMKSINLSKALKV